MLIRDQKGEHGRSNRTQCEPGRRKACPYDVPGLSVFNNRVGASPPSRDDYVLLNGRIGYRCLDGKAEVALSGYNILADRHREHPFGDEVGSRVLLSVHFDY